ncbi:hypothetical protein CY35_05G088900 [Sphagnum magellanicum]|nr:hypothetical protein CY35_05G088900 [Sphagnum magellanicum]
MNPPPKATYDNVDALKAACRQHAAVHLYSVTTKRSDYKMGILLLHCDKSGTRDDHHGRRNQVGSCTLHVKCGEHNHSPLTLEAAHPSHRKMTNDVKEHVRTLSVAGVAPAQILTLIRSKPSYASGRLTRLAFISTKAVQLTRRFGTVLTMDYTYKTNRFKMPLLHIVSFAYIGATFTSAIAFLSAETIEDYEVMRASTEDELQEKLVQIQTEWVGTQPHAVQYVLSWMQYKTYFVGAYVGKVPHFESSSSSHVEGAHSTLKQCL